MTICLEERAAAKSLLGIKHKIRSQNLLNYIFIGYMDAEIKGNI